MFIDLKKAKNEFQNYTKNYDIKNEKIDLKIQHSLRVMDVSKKLAKMINLPEEDIEIAEIIGLLHDIARFEQVTKYNTFNDNISFDHGDYAIEILNNNLRNYIKSDKYDNLIKIAIKNHNKYEIQFDLSDREILFSKIIRDADKIDILNQATFLFWKNNEDLVNNADINPKVLDSFIDKTLINRQEEIKYTSLDMLIVTIGYIFDLNFKESFQIIKEENYINKILDRFNYKNPETINKIRTIANDFIDSKIKEA